MRLNDDSRDHKAEHKTDERAARPKTDKSGRNHRTAREPAKPSEPQGAMADAFRRALK
jgi:hypothetical protein